MAQSECQDNEVLTFEQASALHWIHTDEKPEVEPKVKKKMFSAGKNDEEVSEPKEILMKVCYTHFSTGAVIRERYRQGVDYLSHDFDLGFDDTLYLLKELKNERCGLSIHTSKHILYFFIDSEKNLWVDLFDINGLWAQSEVSLEAATEIIRIAFEGGEFDELIPTTSKEWDAYAWPFKYDS